MVASEILIACTLVACGSPPATPMPAPRAPDPSIQVPNKLAITRTADTLTVGIDPTAREPLAMAIDPSLVAGVKYTLRVHPEGVPATGDRGTGLASGLDFNLGERIFHRAQDGLPVTGTHYVVEIDLAVFETDVPAGHMWNPESARYRVRWSRTLVQRID